jgi:hypothetical protein
MREIVGYLLISGALLAGFAGLLVAAIRKKPRRQLGTYAAVCLLLVAGAAARAAYLFARKSYAHLAALGRPRTGPEIYAALFGPPATCLQVIRQQDQVVPKIDYAIWLEFETCPTELRRILGQHKFVATREATSGWNTSGPQAGNNWFKPEALGDSVLVFRYRKDDYGNGQTIFAALDSTRAYCMDVQD